MTGLLTKRPWLAPTRTDAVARVFCLPFAGGGPSAFRTWRAAIPHSVDVCPVAFPGREMRLREPPISDMTTLVRELADALQPALDRPFSLFGYSMGAWVAFELARELRRRHAPAPRQLLLAARRAPHLVDPSPIADLPDSQFVRALQDRYNALPAAILSEPELLALYLPALRADFRVLDHYRHAPDAKLEMPISLWYGADDRNLRPELVEPWADHTRAACALHALPTGHFFHTDPRFIAAVAQAVSP